MPSAKLSVTIQQYKGGGSTWVVMYSSCMNGLKCSSHKTGLCKRRLRALSRNVYFVETFRGDAFQKRLKVSGWYAPTLTCARHIRNLHS